MIINKYTLYLSSQLNNYYLYLNRINYNKCINEMNLYFDTNRLNDQFRGDHNIYDIYKSRSYPFSMSYSNYILRRLKIFGDLTVTDYLKHHNLKSIVLI